MALDAREQAGFSRILLPLLDEPDAPDGDTVAARG